MREPVNCIRALFPTAHRPQSHPLDKFHCANLIAFSIAIRILRCDNGPMTSREFIRRARGYARRSGQSFRFDPTHGKGSHGRVYIGLRFTTVQRGELKKGILAAMLRQLNIDQREF